VARLRRRDVLGLRFADVQVADRRLVVVVEGQGRPSPGGPGGMMTGAGRRLPGRRDGGARRD
jgi:hypothetical protein